jgi:hypothetical protein
VSALAFSPDGRVIASGDYGHTVRFWDAATGQSVRAPIEQRGVVFSVAFSPDGKTLAVGDSFGVTWIDVDLESWRRLAGRVANRNLTRDEWRLYFPDTPYRPTFNELPVPPEASPRSKGVP